MKTTLVILFAFAIGTCYNNQFLRNLADVTVSKVTSDNCVDLTLGAQIVLAATAASGTASAVSTATDLGITLEAGTDTITTKCTMTAELVITCTTEKAAATSTSAVQYSVKVAADKTVDSDTFKTTTLTNAITHKAGVVLNKPSATQADAAKKINYGEAKEEDLAFTIEFGADVGTTVPKVKANTKELTCTKDSENGKKVKCTFDEETLPADKDDAEKEVAYPVTYTNECGTESPTGITVTVSSSAFNTLSK